jgi:hypothetical protein
MQGPENKVLVVHGHGSLFSNHLDISAQQYQLKHILPIFIIEKYLHGMSSTLDRDEIIKTIEDTPFQRGPSTIGLQRLITAEDATHLFVDFIWT